MENRVWILKQRPDGTPAKNDVTFTKTPIPSLEDGQILVKNLYASIDPAIRGWMSSAPSYIPPIPLDSPIWATTLGRVISSKSPNHPEGSLVVGFGTWADYTVQDGSMYMQNPDDGEFPLTNYLSVLGYIGLTAFFGLLDVGKPKAGETVLVSAAAGAVGSLVGQIAKIKGCRTVGLAGTDEKCRQLIEEFNYDDAINYRELGDCYKEIGKAIAKTCPEGVDIYFDNVGGPILDGALMNLNFGARIPMCGAISSYNAKEPVPGPYNLWQLLVKSARLEGFIVSNYVPHRVDEAIPVLSQWLKSGQIKQREEVIVGLENTFDGFLKLFSGTNQGKLIVEINSEK